MNERLKELRKKFDLNQEEFGKRIGIGKTSISKLESGENNPSEQTILLICREFNINEEWLRTGKGEMRNQTDAIDIAFNHFGYIMGNATPQKKPYWRPL